MATTTLEALGDSPARRRLARLRRVLRRAPILPTLLVLLTVVVALVGPILAPYDPTDANVRLRHTPPLFFGGGTAHPLGTDFVGRDVLSRIVVGTRVSMSVAVVAILVGGGVGTALGLIAGFSGGWLGAFIMRATDAMLAFPSILIALILAVTVGPSFWIVVIVIGLILWARYARLVRGEVLSLKERDFIARARISGCSPWRIVLRHILPNVTNSIVVLSTLQVGWAIIVEASLSFLGAGIPPPAPSWGGMVADGRNYIYTAWWVSVFPGIAIMLVVLSFNLFGDWLRDALDAKLRQV